MYLLLSIYHEYRVLINTENSICCPSQQVILSLAEKKKIYIYKYSIQYNFPQENILTHILSHFDSFALKLKCFLTG